MFNRQISAQRAGHRKTARFRPHLELLEGRALPSVTSAFIDSNGDLVADRLVVFSDGASDSITITCVGGDVKVNGSDPGTGAVDCDDVQSIFVDGGDGADTIDLSGVTTADFDGLSDGNVTVGGGKGNDTITGSEFDDLLQGGFGNDEMNGGLGDDTLLGGKGTDTLNGGGGNDLLRGGTGVDLAPDVMNGDSGNDTLVGGWGADTMNGGTGDDQLNGGKGNDRLVGGDGADTLVGGQGADLLVAGDGIDTTGDGIPDSSSDDDDPDFLDGGPGVDTCLFNDDDTAVNC
jgi:Ca2+-binding RTX toxin-like protein